jgi:hypothetical protein
VTTPRAIELAVAVALFVTGLVLYRRRDKTDSYGSQGAVILFVVAAIMAIHALGGLDYHPTTAEADLMRSRAR